MLHYVIFLSFLIISLCSLQADCGKQSLSCPLDPTFLKEAEAFSKTSLEKVENVLQTEGFKSLLAEIENTPKPLNQPNRSVDLYVFVSFSMGEKSLLNLAREAKFTGATLVMKGFKDNSLKKTVAALYKIILTTGQGVSIDPELFKTFKVIAVPTFVLANDSRHDRLQGHVSLAYALETFTKEGELKNEAQALLNKGRRP